jgi:hypothetical protein
VGSKTFSGVWFSAYSHDHGPPHVHGEYGEVTVVVDLLPDGVRKSGRRDAVTPGNAKANHVRRILELAALHRRELMALREATRGKTS